METVARASLPHSFHFISTTRVAVETFHFLLLSKLPSEAHLSPRNPPLGGNNNDLESKCEGTRSLSTEGGEEGEEERAAAEVALFEVRVYLETNRTEAPWGIGLGVVCNSRRDSRSFPLILLRRTLQRPRAKTLVWSERGDVFIKAD